METVADFIFLGCKITADGDCSHEIKRRSLLERKVMTNLDSILKSRDITLPTKVCLTETSMLWPHDAKSWLIWKDPDAGKDWGQEEKGMTDDEMVGWHHRLNGHGFGWTLGVGDGQGGLACCSSWGYKELDMTERLNWTEPPGMAPGILLFQGSNNDKCIMTRIPHDSRYLTVLIILCALSNRPTLPANPWSDAFTDSIVLLFSVSYSCNHTVGKTFILVSFI